MSQLSLDVIRGIAQAAANSYDGALDDKGEPIKIGLKREEGNPMLDTRVMDGFKVRLSGDKLIVSYQSDIKLKDVYKGNFQNEIEDIMSDIVSFLKKEYKKITGKALALKAVGECDSLVQSTSSVRVFVNASKTYQIGGVDDVEENEKPSEERLEGSFKKFLDQGGWGQKAPNKNQKGG